MNRTHTRQRIGSLVTVAVLWSWIVGAVLREPPSNALSWDTFGYYLYLPATLLHNDLALQDQAWVQEALETYHNSTNFYQAGRLPDGRWVMKYSMGLAVLWVPVFVIAHVAAGLSGHPQDGFSAPYQWAVVVTGLLYVLVGLLLTRRVLGHFFNDRVTTIVLALLVLGTNYLHQALSGYGMPHVILFTFYAAILWRTIRWYEERRMRDAVLLALLMGLTILSRPSEVVCLLIPLLYGLKDVRNWKEHLRSLWVQRRQLVVMGAVLLLIGLPQFLYWKWLTGQFLYMSYNNPGEGFEFLHPFIWEVLFSFRKGWYIYTPIMAIATGGLFLMQRTLPELRTALVAFFILNLYIIGSWSCWWYAESFGQRAPVQSYAVMLLPLGCVVHWLGERRLRAVAGATVLVVLTVFNLFQTYQSRHGLIHTSRMTWPAYKAVFGRTVPPPDLGSLLLVDRTPTGNEHGPDLRDYRKRPFMTMGFDAPFPGVGSTRFRDSITYRGKGAFLLTADSVYSPPVHAHWNELTSRSHLWVHVQCAVHLPAGDGAARTVALVATFDHNDYTYSYKALRAIPDPSRTDGWSTVSFWYLTPEVRSPRDRLLVYAWLEEGGATLVDEIEVTLYEPIARY
ncbi:MAG TPA: hypothetical protein PLB89_16590 [Flavobacteriales bacterium]|nr:hypothetical protein [Flavobacteriales bacterium]